MKPENDLALRYRTFSSKAKAFNLYVNTDYKANSY